ncbi:MAG: DUF4215 domain-containing protein [Nannocystaceae bacterium]
MSARARPRLARRAIGAVAACALLGCFTDHGGASSTGTDATDETEAATMTTAPDPTTGTTAPTTSSTTSGEETTVDPCPPGELGCPCGDGPCVEGSVCIDDVCDHGCGDGALARPEELCDDANAIEGDGCNNDCQPSGALRWVKSLGDDVTSIRAIDVAVSGGGVIYVTGVSDDGGVEGSNIWVAALSADGELSWARHFDHQGGDDAGTAITVASSGAVVVTGVARDVGDMQVAWVHRLDPQGNPLWDQPAIYDGGPLDDSAHDVAIGLDGTIHVVGGRGVLEGLDLWYGTFATADGVNSFNHVVAREGDDEAFAVAVYEEVVVLCGRVGEVGVTLPYVRTIFDGAQASEWLGSPDDGDTILHDCVVDGGGVLHLAITQKPDVTLYARFQLDATGGLTPITPGSSLGPITYGLAVDDVNGHVITTGYVISGGDDIFVRRAPIEQYNVEVWLATYAGMFGGVDRGAAVALTPERDVVAVGSVTIGDAVSQAWIGRYSP